MKNVWRKISTLFLMVAMMTLMIGMTASAATKTVVMDQDGDNTYYHIGTVLEKTTVYHKITVKKSGILVVMAAESDDESGNTKDLRISLCNSKKKTLEQKSAGKTVNLDSKYAYYGVKKGTYYIKLTSSKNYGVVAAFQAVADKGGASKGKAATMKAGTDYIGVMPVGESGTKADWFKFKVTRSKKLALTLENATDGTIDFYVYGPSLSSKGVRIRMKKGVSGTYTVGKSSTRTAVKLKKGTYYVKAVRYSKNKKSSGLYSVNWKLR